MSQHAVLTAPSGLGTAAARFADQLARACAVAPPPETGDPAYGDRTWGDGTASPLYCPVTERINEPLADEVDARLVA